MAQSISFFKFLMEVVHNEDTKISALQRDPWILQLEEFLSPSECASIIAEAREQWVPDVTTIQDASTDTRYRNSSSFNCVADSCRKFPAMQRLRERMSSFLRMSDGSSVGIEHGDGLHVLRYQPGGFFKKHHDYIPETRNPKMWQNCGQRVLTFMVYLNDVEFGGETHFFHLDVKVKPKMGRALIWPDVSSEMPFERDDRLGTRQYQF